LKKIAIVGAALLSFCNFAVPHQVDFNSSGAAWAAADEEEYKAGIALYTKKDYAAAAAKFWKSITAGNSSAGAYLYMAHAYYGAQNIYEALNTYHSILDLFKGSKEAEVASQCIKRIDPQNLWRRDQPLPAALVPKTPPVTATTSSTTTTITPRAASMLDRITVVPPRKGHPAVSGEMIRMVKSAIQAMPPHLNKICLDGNVNINILTNASDKWPESIDQIKFEDSVYAQEEGHTYGRDIYLYERPVVEKGSFALAAPFKPDVVRWATLFQLFHGVDACLGPYSKDPALDEAYKNDLERVLDDKKGVLAEYINGDHGPADTFAELGVGLIGGRGPLTAEVDRHFPLTKALVKKKLRI
jgi:hypothetical protein